MPKSVFAAKLEAMGITSEFAAGVLMARMLEGVKFALGSTRATMRTRLESIGGFHALADYLADDFMLGNLIERAGYEIRLSRHIVETVMQPAGFMAMMRHQMRWAVDSHLAADGLSRFDLDRWNGAGGVECCG